ncbi:MAG: hypothetical protein ACTSWQ_03615 [Candidatus Thorarchaeota archaeon]
MDTVSQTMNDLAERIKELEQENKDLRSEIAWVYGLKEGAKFLASQYVEEIRKNKLLQSKLHAIVGDESGAMPNATLEAVANVSHEIWAHWMTYQFSVCEEALNGSVYIPVESYQRWARQIVTPYADLTEREKDSDREQAEKILAAIREI